MTPSITTQYFQKYRKELGFTNQGDVKKFFAAKDIAPTVDYAYIALLNGRLIDIVKCPISPHYGCLIQNTQKR